MIKTIPGLDKDLKPYLKDVRYALEATKEFELQKYFKRILITEPLDLDVEDARRLHKSRKIDQE